MPVPTTRVKLGNNSFDFKRAARLLGDCRERKLRRERAALPVNRAKTRPYVAGYLRHKRKVDPQYTIKDNFHRAVRYMLAENWTRGKWVEVIGKTGAELRAYLELLFLPGMSWETRGGKSGWQVDCRIPCALFDLTDSPQAKKCFHYTNLQPLWPRENQAKETPLR